MIHPTTLGLRTSVLPSSSKGTSSLRTLSTRNMKATACGVKMGLSCHAVLCLHDMLLPSLGRMSFMEALRPPVKEGGGANKSRLRLKRHTALGLCFFEFLD